MNEKKILNREVYLGTAILSGEVDKVIEDLQKVVTKTRLHSPDSFDHKFWFCKDDGCLYYFYKRPETDEEVEERLNRLSTKEQILHQLAREFGYNLQKKGT